MSIQRLSTLALTFALVQTADTDQVWALSGPKPGAATAQTVRLPSGPGSIRGLAADPSVDGFTGQMSHQVPLELPGAVRAFAPRLSLAYSGALGNGPMGIGWGLGQVAIRRSTRLGVPTFTDEDELLLSGTAISGRLIRADDGTYRVEGEGNAIIVRPAGDGFEVTDSDGIVYRLGISAGARMHSGGQVVAWFADEVEDLAGQQISYAYDRDQNQVYLRTIEWGPRGSFQVSLAYQARPDVVTSFRTGFAVTVARRLETIQVRAFGETLRRYVLTYDDQLPLSRLSQVQLVGRGGDTMPPTRFEYAGRQASETQELDGTGGWRLSDAGVVLVDVDGDGAADLLNATALGHVYRRNLGGSFGPVEALSGSAGLALSGARLVDVEGRARPNFVNAIGGIWHAFRITGPGWTSLGTWTGTEGVPLLGSNVHLADVNGDGRADVVESVGTGFLLRLGTAQGLTDPVSRPAVADTLEISSNVRLNDQNGDGLVDAVELQDGWMGVYLGRGDGTFEGRRVINWPWESGTVAQSDIRFGDLDRDGLQDLVAVTAGDVRWYQGQPAGAFSAVPRTLPRPPGASVSVTVVLADANGNGSEDVVWSAPEGIWVLDLAGPASAGMLTAVDDGLGKRVRVEYQASAVLARQASSDGDPWFHHLPVSVPVVTALQTDLADGTPSRRMEWLVRDGFWDPEEYAFAGFMRSEQRWIGDDGSAERIESTHYHGGNAPHRVLRGKPIRVRLNLGDGTLIRETNNWWWTANVPDISGDDPRLRVPLLYQSQIANHEGRASPLFTRIEYRHDAQGRIIRETHQGRLDLQGDERIVERTYADSPETGVRGRVCEERLRSGEGTLLRHARNYFGDHQDEAPHCQTGIGWPRRSESYLAEETRWIDKKRTTYDALGNPTAVYSEGATRHYRYDAQGLFLTDERMLLDDGTELAWSLSWDPVLGKPVTQTDPNGHTQRVDYDGLGRPTSVALNDDLPHIHYRYRDEAPRPSVERFVFDGPRDALTALPPTWTAASSWRHAIDVQNSAGDPIFSAKHLNDQRWVVAGYREYDAAGRPVLLGDPVYYSGEALPTGRPQGLVGQSIIYDDLGRAVDQQLAGGARKTMRYRAFEKTATVEGLAPVTITLDGFARIIENRRETEQTWVTYDAADQVQAMQITGASGTAEHSFRYDALGRLQESADSDSGARLFFYDDAGRMTRVENAENQAVDYSYDTIGRLRRVALDDGSELVYHYDTSPAGTNDGNQRGRLAWIEEPTGRVDLTYDAEGRVASKQRAIDGRTGLVENEFTASGLLSAIRFDGRLRVPYVYDALARPMAVGEIWAAEELDAAGRPVRERFGNGASQTTYRDEAGRPYRVRLFDGDARRVYDVFAGRHAWGAIGYLWDLDRRGLDHSARFDYDARSRLTRVRMGRRGPVVELSFAYDDLQNMTTRGVSSPVALGILDGTYAYGERGSGPRQLTSITTASGETHRFRYDLAGRQVSKDEQTMLYNGLDQLMSVEDAPGASATPLVAHDYGYDGLRLRTVSPEGAWYWFDPAITDRGGARQYVVRLGERVLATVAGRRSGGSTAASGTVFYHGTFSEAPALFTGEDGRLLEERRFTPFGAPIDAWTESGAGDVGWETSTFNNLNKETDPTTGWSYHGARWMAVETARWLTPDPPTQGPDARYAVKPWSLHPYQYVDQNPVVFWDPDGRDKSRKKPGWAPDEWDVIEKVASKNPLTAFYFKLHEPAIEAFKRVQKTVDKGHSIRKGLADLDGFSEKLSKNIGGLQKQLRALPKNPLDRAQGTQTDWGIDYGSWSNIQATVGDYEIEALTLAVTANQAKKTAKEMLKRYDALAKEVKNSKGLVRKVWEDFTWFEVKNSGFRSTLEKTIRDAGKVESAARDRVNYARHILGKSVPANYTPPSY